MMSWQKNSKDLWQIRYILLVSFLFFFLFIFTSVTSVHAFQKETFWEIQGVDTMKFSRDRARRQVSETVIKSQIQTVKELGANYVAVDTPYDEEFTQVLRTWANTAHSLGLHVWFRGNWSGWEGWFNYPKTLTPEEHIAKTKQFIQSNSDLFKDGDSFTACPECEYGGPLNPHKTSDTEAFKQFLLREHTETSNAFAQIGKHIFVNWQSMNPDVAKKVVDREFIEKMGNLLVLDDYVANIKELDDHVSFFTQKFPNIKIFLGEFGAPIPDINGTMTEKEQKEFVEMLFNYFYQNKNVIVGVNYWVLTSGSTALLNDDGTKRKVTQVLQTYFSPAVISGSVTDELGDAIENVVVRANKEQTETDKNGKYSFPVLYPNNVSFLKEDYHSNLQVIKNTGSKNITMSTILYPQNPSLFYRIKVFVKTFKEKF